MNAGELVALAIDFPASDIASALADAQEQAVAIASHVHSLPRLSSDQATNFCTRVGAEPADVHEFQQMVSDEDNPETSTAPGMLGSENVATGKTQPSSSGTGQRPKRQRLNESQRAILHSVLDDYIAGVLSSQQKQQVAQRTGLPQKKVLKYASCCLHPCLPSPYAALVCTASFVLQQAVESTVDCIVHRLCC